MRGTWIGRLRAGTKSLISDRRGNAFMLTAAAIIPVIGFVGSAVDIGRGYMAQLRLQQACDAGVLAGRRAMAGGSYDDAAKAEANKMFNFNFPEAKYGASGILFSSQADGASDVVGQASAVLPTELMFMFGKDEFRLSADCTAKLEISNVDVMLVLDVTGSMARKADEDDDDTKIVALQGAAIDFFDTLTTADIGDGRLRFGVVPYSSSVNVGRILAAENPNWLADEVRLPSRTPKTEIVYTETDRDESNFQDTHNPDVFDKDLGKCKGGLPADTTPQPGQPNANLTEQYVDADGNRISTYDVERTYSYYKYKQFQNGEGQCREGRWIASFVRSSTTEITETPTKVFDGEYRYEDRSFDTRSLKAGSTMESDTGDQGALVTTSWGGCIIERGTTPFTQTQTAPDDAFDMDIDLVPTADVDTQWKLFLPNVTYNRNQVSPYWSTSNIRDFEEQGGDYAACPVAAMNMTTMSAASRDTFASYINSLRPRGYTYHDAGMAWGARLLSPTGLFADENASATNGRPISRHIVFMTDGEMVTPRANLSHQGQERSLPRVGSTSDSDGAARHNNRFVQLCRSARQRGMTIWVVSFGVGSNANLNNCASSGQAFEADNAAELNEQFQAIARQISKLRLSQ